jgi:hypothetical protein
MDKGASVNLSELLARINEWDSQNALFFGPDTSNICATFRWNLRAAVDDISNPSNHQGLLNLAARPELALRSDIGIHGIDVSRSDLSPRQRDMY